MSNILMNSFLPLTCACLKVTSKFMLEYQLMIGMRVSFTERGANGARLLTYPDLPKRHEISVCITVSCCWHRLKMNYHCLNGFSRITIPDSTLSEELTSEICQH